MTKPNVRLVAFVDTNVLHYVSLYLREAKSQDLFPFGGEFEAAKEYLEKRSDRRLRRSLVNGLNVTARLRNENIRVQYSSVSELELIAGRARGKAIEKAAAEGMPDRMWTRIFEKDVGDRLVDTDLAAIKTGVERLRAMLEDASIDATVEKKERARDVLDVAKDVMGLVYMGVVDSMIYAGALVADADELISADAYLKNTVNRIKTDASWRGVRERLEQRLANVLVRPPSDVVLPSATGIPADGH